MRLANIRKINKRKQKPKATQEFGLCVCRQSQPGMASTGKSVYASVP